VRHLIREQKTAQLPNALQTGAQYGMQTLSQALQRLQTQGLITPEEAAAHAP
jgi:twitching motility protein PilT